MLVAKYNNAIIEAYKNQFFAPLTEVAGEKQVNKARVVINSFRRGNQVMEADVRKIDFKEIKRQGDKASVRTSEDWVYRWVDIKTGKEVEPLKDIHYEIVYHLVKKDGKWLVEKAEDETSKAAGG